MFESKAKYPTAKEFREWLKTGLFGDLVERWVFQGSVFAFEEQPNAAEVLKSHLAERIGTTMENIRVVGSAKVGFSLGPDTFGRTFSFDADIDVVIADTDLFDEFWHSVLRWNYPRRRERLIAADFNFRNARSRDLYWGWVQPDRVDFGGVSYAEHLDPIKQLKVRWFDAFKGLARYRDFARRDISGRLYRSWDVARLYHEHGLWLIHHDR